MVLYDFDVLGLISAPSVGLGIVEVRAVEGVFSDFIKKHHLFCFARFAGGGVEEQALTGIVNEDICTSRSCPNRACEMSEVSVVLGAYKVQDVLGGEVVAHVDIQNVNGYAGGLGCLGDFFFIRSATESLGICVYKSLAVDAEIVF